MTTPQHEMRELRIALKLSQNDFGRLLGLEGNDPGRVIRRWENNEREISGPVKKLMEYIKRDHNL